MKKFFTGVVKFLTTLAILGALAYAVVTYWDKIVGFLNRAKSLLAEKGCCCAPSAEHDDYADWDE